MARQVPARSRGFTLIELMVVVVIATILISIAVPSYMSQIQRGRRVQAKTALLDLAGREERFMSTAQTGSNYTDVPGNLGYAAWGQTIGDGYYTVTVCAVGPNMSANCPPSNQAAPGFVVTATAAGTQTKDTQCQVFQIDNTGTQWAFDANNNPNTTLCWNN
ncbi:MAG: prepilin-type N-terminal cleavage/methylation domain-containing protein [Proteobacteria bacterium]|nr:prepilin-type N-terminal cleavage/methylation domain-containing protein [Pseudomonadota bacterium]